MRMAFATASGSQMSDMNVTPLVDVMLVLLIIFMVTVPAINYANDIGIQPSPPAPISIEPLKVHIGAGDTISLNGEPMTLDQLKARFALEARPGIVNGVVDPKLQPAVQLSVEPDAEYELVARVLARAKDANLAKVGFAAGN
jgi:biopolymer transport protein ExbD